MKQFDSYEGGEDTSNAKREAKQYYKEVEFRAQLQLAGAFEGKDISESNIGEDMDAEQGFLDWDSYLSDGLDDADAKELYTINTELDALEEEFYV